MTFTRSCLLILCLTSVLRADLVKDRQLVRDKEIGTEPKAWLGFLESRILDERKESRLTSLIRQLASDLYTDREKAMAQLIQWGEVARPWLRKALKSSDLEVVRRSRVCLKKITVGESSRLTQAVIRLLAQKLTREVASTFIRYLPFSDDLSVQSEIHESLLKADVKDKELSTLLIASLQSKYPIVQGTAASILGRRREATIQKLVRPLLGHSDFKVRFQAGSALLQGEDATAMPAMLQLLEVAPLQIAWAVEDLLHQLASDKAPKTTLTGDPSDRKKTRRSWELWWESSASKVRLASLRESPAELGRTLGIEYNTSRVWECNRQGRMLWDIYVKSAMDARVLPGQRVLVVGAEGVSIRDFHGKVLKQIKTGVSPNGCAVLPGGRIFVSCYSRVLEIDAKGKTVYDFKIQGTNAIRWSRRGTILLANRKGLVELDTKGKELRTIALPKGHFWAGLDHLPGDRFLVSSSSTGLIVEIDSTGKERWRANVPGACGINGLKNGHVLVATRGRVVELNRAGKIVWEKKSKGYVRRAHRR